MPVQGRGVQLKMKQTPIPYFNCTNLTESEFRMLPLARGITAAVCLLLCIITFVVVIITKTYKTTLQRLFLCLTLSTVAYLVVLTSLIEHYLSFESPNFEGCKALGFFNQYTGSVQLLYTLEITLFLFYKVSDKLCRIKERLQWTVVKNPQFRFCVQVALFSLPWTVPPLFDTIPFFITPYGETGPWCWIQTLNRNCTEDEAGFREQLGLWYIPFGLVSVCSLGFILYMAIVLSCWILKCEIAIKKVHGLKSILADTLLLIIFLIAYCILFAIELTGRIIVNKNSKNSFGVWIMYAVCTPLGAVTIPIAFLVYLFCSGTINCQRCCKHGSQEVELDEAASGALPSDEVSVASFTDDRPLPVPESDDESQPLFQSHQQKSLNQPEAESETKSQKESCCVM